MISFNLVYPSPVIITLTRSLGVSPAEALAEFGLPLSLLLFIPAFVYLGRIPISPRRAPLSSPLPPPRGRLVSWAPLALPILMILAGLIYPPMGLLGSPDVALLAGALLSAALAKEMRRRRSRGRPGGRGW